MKGENPHATKPQPLAIIKFHDEKNHSFFVFHYLFNDSILTK